MINRSNMDAVWAIIGSKHGNEKATFEELAALGKENIDLIIYIQEAFEDGAKMQELLKSYWKLDAEKKIQAHVEKQAKKKVPQSVVIKRIYYTRYGEPLKRGDKITWHSVGGVNKGVLQDYHLSFKQFDERVRVICKVSDDKGAYTLHDGASFGLEGKEGEKYFDAWLDSTNRETCFA